MRKEKKIFPELRFPEFEKDGEWVEKKLGDLGYFLGGGTPDRSNSDYWIGDIPWISSSDIRENDIHNISITRFINDDAIKKSATKLIPKGSILFISRVGVGKLALNKDELCTSQDFTSFVPDSVLNYFIGYYFIANKLLLQSLNQGTSIKGFSKNDLENFFLKYPKNKYEQQKIAACLLVLDELIAAHRDKLQALQDHKKGLMQNLFPQKGHKVPNYRFPEFVKDGEWKLQKVEKCFDVKSSKRVLQKDWKNEGVPFYRTRELVSLSKNEPFGSEIYISGSLYSELKEKYGVPTEGDFLVSGVGTLGICYQVQANEKFYFKDGNVLWFKLKGNLYPTFFKYCFESGYIQDQINAQTSKSTVGTYTIQNARKTGFWYPPKKNEQQKIASCLLSLDELIAAQAEKIAQLQLHKKGLMQGLFPKIDG